MNQNVNSSSNVNVNLEIQQKVEELVKELEKEFQKSNPDKSKLEMVINKIGTLAPFATKIIEQLTEKLNDLFF